VSAITGITLSTVFLYTILGWRSVNVKLLLSLPYSEHAFCTASAFVGFAVMVALVPVPAWISKVMRDVRKE
jgi:hypothetical protein